MGLFNTILFSLNKALRNGRGIYDSDQRLKIAKRLAQDKDITVDKLYSERNYQIGNKPSEWGKENIGRAQENDMTATNTQVGSTAIDTVKYNPQTEECKVKYKNGDKFYNFVNMPPEQFKQYMQSGSKGRYTQKMRVTNHDPNYPKTIE